MRNVYRENRQTHLLRTKLYNAHTHTLRRRHNKPIKINKYSMNVFKVIRKLLIFFLTISIQKTRFSSIDEKE